MTSSPGEKARSRVAGAPWFGSYCSRTGDAIAATKQIPGARLLVAGDPVESVNGYRSEAGDLAEWRGSGYLPQHELERALGESTLALFPLPAGARSERRTPSGPSARVYRPWRTTSPESRSRYERFERGTRRSPPATSKRWPRRCAPTCSEDPARHWQQRPGGRPACTRRRSRGTPRPRRTSGLYRGAPVRSQARSLFGAHRSPDSSIFEREQARAHRRLCRGRAGVQPGAP